MISYIDVDLLDFQVAQLHHELNLKDELLQFYTNAAEESEGEASGSPTSVFSVYKTQIHSYSLVLVQRIVFIVSEAKTPFSPASVQFESSSSTTSVFIYTEAKTQFLSRSSPVFSVSAWS